MYGSLFPCALNTRRRLVSGFAILQRVIPLASMAVAFACLIPAAGRAQDDTFLRCANILDRDTRVQCLENALEQAVSTRDANRNSSPAPSSAAPAPPSQVQSPDAATSSLPVAASASAGNAETSGQNDTRRFDLFGLFDREKAAQAEQERRGTAAMYAKVAELQFYKPDVLTITLDNGQIWRQRYARRYSLREGDAVNISQSGWGTRFRLEAERFNGFIQVERLR